MAGTHFTATVDDKEYRAFLEEQARLQAGSVLPRMGEYVQQSTERRFKTQTGPDGAPWTPLQKRYAGRKKYNKTRILTLRGYLRGGIRYQMAGQDAVDVGTDSKYGAIHQFGGTIDIPARTASMRFRTKAGRILFAGKKHKRATEKTVTIGAHQVKIPARRFLGISDADDARLKAILREWREEQLKG